MANPPYCGPTIFIRLNNQCVDSHYDLAVKEVETVRTKGTLQEGPLTISHTFVVHENLIVLREEEYNKLLQERNAWEKAYTDLVKDLQREYALKNHLEK